MVPHPERCFLVLGGSDYIWQSAKIICDERTRNKRLILPHKTIFQVLFTALTAPAT